MEAEEARKRRDEEREETRKKGARSRLSVKKGAGKLTSKAQSNSYAGFQYVIVNVPATVSEIVRGHCPLFSNIYEMYVNLSNQQCANFLRLEHP